MLATSKSVFRKFAISPLGETLKNKFRCTPLGTKVAIYHFVGNFVQKLCKHVFVGQG